MEDGLMALDNLSGAGAAQRTIPLNINKSSDLSKDSLATRAEKFAHVMAEYKLAKNHQELSQQIGSLLNEIKEESFEEYKGRKENIKFNDNEFQLSVFEDKKKITLIPPGEKVSFTKFNNTLLKLRQSLDDHYKDGSKENEVAKSLEQAKEDLFSRNEFTGEKKEEIISKCKKGSVYINFSDQNKQNEMGIKDIESSINAENLLSNEISDKRDSEKVKEHNDRAKREVLNRSVQKPDGETPTKKAAEEILLSSKVTSNVTLVKGEVPVESLGADAIIIFGVSHDLKNRNIDPEWADQVRQLSGSGPDRNSGETMIDCLYEKKIEELNGRKLEDGESCIISATNKLREHGIESIIPTAEIKKVTAFERKILEKNLEWISAAPRNEKVTEEINPHEKKIVLDKTSKLYNTYFNAFEKAKQNGNKVVAFKELGEQSGYPREVALITLAEVLRNFKRLNPKHGITFKLCPNDTEDSVFYDVKNKVEQFFEVSEITYGKDPRFKATALSNVTLVKGEVPVESLEADAIIIFGVSHDLKNRNIYPEWAAKVHQLSRPDPDRNSGETMIDRLYEKKIEEFNGRKLEDGEPYIVSATDKLREHGIESIIPTAEIKKVTAFERNILEKNLEWISAAARNEKFTEKINSSERAIVLDKTSKLYNTYLNAFNEAKQNGNKVVAFKEFGEQSGYPREVALITLAEVLRDFERFNPNHGITFKLCPNDTKDSVFSDAKNKLEQFFMPTDKDA